MMRSFKCPVCGGDLSTFIFSKYNSSREIVTSYVVKCYTCSLFGESVCDCIDLCLPNLHYEKACVSLKEGALFLKDFILKGGFNE